MLLIVIWGRCVLQMDVQDVQSNPVDLTVLSHVDCGSRHTRAVRMPRRVEGRKHVCLEVSVTKVKSEVS